MFRKLTFSLICALVAVGICASTALADDFTPKTLCVTSAYPALPAGCDSTWPFTRNGLQDAISYANAVTDHRGDDTVKIDPGTIEVTNPVQSIIYTAAAGFGALRIVGAGKDATKLSGVYTEGPGPHFIVVQMNVTAAPTSSIESLSIEPGPASTLSTGLSINGGTVDGVGIKAFGDDDFMRRGLVTTGSGVTVKNSAISGGGIAQGYGIYNIGHELNVYDTTFEHPVQPYENEHYGIYSTGTLIGRRLKFIGERSAITFAGTQMEIYDSLFDMGAAESAVTVNAGAVDGSFLLHGATVVGNAPNQVAVRLIGSTHQMSGDIRDSLFDLNGAGSTEMSCGIPGGGAPSQIYVFNSMYATKAGCVMDPIDSLIRSGSLQPAYVNAGAGDYRPAAGSPVVDAGSATAFRLFEPKLDLAGMQRFVDGNGDGSALIDIGAYEFQPGASTGGGGGTTTQPALSIKLGKPVGKFKLKRKAKAFKLTGKRTKPRLPITSSARVKIKLTLKKGKKKIKGSQSLTIPAGKSYLTFSGKFAGKKLKPGKYTLYVTASGLKDAPKSILNVIR